MAKTTVDELLRTARADPDFEKAYTSAKQRLRGAVAEALFRLRKERNLTQAALAERAGWQQPYVARIERGEAQMIPGLEALENFAQAVDATSIVLFVDKNTGQVRGQLPLGDPAVLEKLPNAKLELALPAEDNAAAQVDFKTLQEHARELLDTIERMNKAKAARPTVYTHIIDLELQNLQQPVGKP